MKTKELGWVYVLSNPSFDQDLIKVGMSQNDPALRSEELIRVAEGENPVSVIAKSRNYLK